MWNCPLPSLPALQSIHTFSKTIAKRFTWEAGSNIFWVQHAQRAVMINLRCQQHDTGDYLVN